MKYEETSSNIALVNQKVDHGNNEKYLQDEIALWDDDNIPEINIFI